MNKCQAFCALWGGGDGGLWISALVTKDPMQQETESRTKTCPGHISHQNQKWNGDTLQ